MELFFIRHGQTDYNAQKRFQGRVDVPLNETGRQQAANMRAALSDDLPQIVRIYSSPLCRATETARLVASNLSIVRLDGRLIEISLGEYDGRLEADIEQEIGKSNYAAWRNSHFVQSAPGGESLASAMQRANAFLQRLDALPVECSVAIVSHQGMLMAIKAALTGQVTASALSQYKQTNDEIEVWLTAPARLSRRIDVSVD